MTKRLSMLRTAVYLAAWLILVPGPTRFCGLFGRDIEYIIPYKCVVNIGEDAILVDVVLEKVSFRCT